MKTKSGKGRGGEWEERKSVIQISPFKFRHTRKAFFFLIMQNTENVKQVWGSMKDA